MDNYGLVFDDVKKMQAMKHLREAEAGPIPQPVGIGENEPAASNEIAVVPYNDTSLINRNQPSAASNQLANIIKKAPTMPKPKWHPPWKLYRVIAGHLGWVRCIAMEPGNEVSIYFMYLSYVGFKDYVILKLVCFLVVQSLLTSIL